MKNKKQKIAIFYDFENINDLEKLLQLIKARFTDYKITTQKAFADWNRVDTNSITLLLNHRVHMHQVITHGAGEKEWYGNASDIALSVEMIEYAIRTPGIDTYALVSGDGGMVNLVEKISSYGKNVIGIANRKAASRKLIESCDDFYFIEEVIACDILNNQELDSKTTQINSVAEDVIIEEKPIQKKELTEDEILRIRAKAETIKEIMEETYNYFQSLVIIVTSFNYQIKSLLSKGISIDSICLLAQSKYNIEREEAITQIKKLVWRYKFVTVAAHDSEDKTMVLTLVETKEKMAWLSTVCIKKEFVIANKAKLVDIIKETSGKYLSKNNISANIIEHIVKNKDNIVGKSKEEIVELLSAGIKSSKSSISDTLDIMINAKTLCGKYKLLGIKKNSIQTELQTSTVISILNYYKRVLKAAGAEMSIRDIGEIVFPLWIDLIPKEKPFKKNKKVRSKI